MVRCKIRGHNCRRTRTRDSSEYGNRHTRLSACRHYHSEKAQTSSELYSNAERPLHLGTLLLLCTKIVTQLTRHVLKDDLISSHSQLMVRSGCGFEFQVRGWRRALHRQWQKLRLRAGCLHPQTLQVCEGQAYVHELSSHEVKLEEVYITLFGGAHCLHGSSSERSCHREARSRGIRAEMDSNRYWSSVFDTGCSFKCLDLKTSECAHCWWLVNQTRLIGYNLGCVYHILSFCAYRAWIIVHSYPQDLLDSMSSTFHRPFFSCYLAYPSSSGFTCMLSFRDHVSTLRAHYLIDSCHICFSVAIALEQNSGKLMTIWS